MESLECQHSDFVFNAFRDREPVKIPNERIGVRLKPGRTADNARK